MKRISIERYKNVEEDGRAGLIEGETDDGQRWILFLDAAGKPEVYWPERADDGEVVGEGIPLRRRGQFAGVFEHLGVPDDADADPNLPEVITTFPVFFPDDTEMRYDENQRCLNDPNEEGAMHGIVFAVVPGEGSASERMCRFLISLSEGFTGRGR
jgi:hypothetical protein